MTQYVSDVMRAPATVEPQTSVPVVARMMRDENIGAFLVAEGEQLRGLVSDRDLVVRAVAEGGDPTVAEVCSDDLLTVKPDDDLGRAVEVMREHSVRRVPVVDEWQQSPRADAGSRSMARSPMETIPTAYVSSTKPNA
ncbi:CBS domain-containing protein [Streptomyces avermitilis]|uniref:CBS domain-containing protein n=1 Tax=Streptomyces avermitilis TaxID=33903 RepID=UPI0033CBF36B